MSWTLIYGQVTTSDKANMIEISVVQLLLSQPASENLHQCTWTIDLVWSVSTEKRKKCLT